MSAKLSELTVDSCGKAADIFRHDVLGGEAKPQIIHRSLVRGFSGGTPNAQLLTEECEPVA